MRKIGWILIGVLSTLIGLYPIAYFLNDNKFGILSSKSPDLLVDVVWNIAFHGHIVFGGISLLIGWLQFSHKLRRTNMSVHRVIGKLYIVAVFISAICGLIIAINATGGIVSMLGFFTLGLIWLITTSLGYLAIKRKNVGLHEKLMIYSYAACFAAVTLRIWLPILIGVLGDFIEAYRIVAWLCWIPNIIVASFIVKNINSGQSVKVGTM